MRAERDRRAAILTAEGVKQSQILTAEGEKQSAILRAEGRRESQILEAEGQSKAIETVFDAIHRGDADPKLLAYQYLQVLPQIAQGESNKVWIIPSEITQALANLELGAARSRPSRRSRRPRLRPSRPLGALEDASCSRSSRRAGRRGDRAAVEELLHPEVEIDMTVRVMNPEVYRGYEGLWRYAADITELWEYGETGGAPPHRARRRGPRAHHHADACARAAAWSSPSRSRSATGSRTGA